MDDDGRVSTSVREEAGVGWQRFVEWTGDEVLAADPSLAEESERNAKQEMIFERIVEWSRRFGKSELAAQCPQIMYLAAGQISGDPRIPLAAVS